MREIIQDFKDFWEELCNQILWTDDIYDTLSSAYDDMQYNQWLKELEEF